MLQQVGYANLRRGDSVGAISELLRAADLSPDGADKGIRLAEAAYLGETVTGDMADVPDLLDAARRADPDMQQTLPGQSRALTTCSTATVTSPAHTPSSSAPSEPAQTPATPATSSSSSRSTRLS